MSDIPNNVKIGRCIYCGNDQGKLTDEHVVPFAFGGRFILRKASCSACQVITSRFEFDILRGPFLTSRLTLGIPTRNKKTRPTQIRYPELTDTDGNKVELGDDASPRLFLILEFPLPGFFNKQPYDHGIKVSAYRMIQVSGPRIKDLVEAGITTIQHSETYIGTSYARFIAKIAHGFAVAAYGLDNFEELFLPNAILGKTDDIGRWVGCLLPPQLGKTEGTYHVSLGQNGPFVLAIVKLFSSWDTPEYLVVVGRLKKQYRLPQELAEKTDQLPSRFVIDPEFSEEPGTTYYGDLAHLGLESLL